MSLKDAVEELRALEATHVLIQSHSDSRGQPCRSGTGAAVPERGSGRCLTCSCLVYLKPEAADVPQGTPPAGDKLLWALAYARENGAEAADELALALVEGARRKRFFDA